jgi:hypothetical protein
LGELRGRRRKRELRRQEYRRLKAEGTGSGSGLENWIEEHVDDGSRSDES